MFYHAVFTKNRLFWGSGLLYDIIVTSYVRCLYLFWYVWKKIPIAILWYQLDVWGSVFKFTRAGMVTIPLVNRVTEKKKFGKTRLKAVCEVFGAQLYARNFRIFWELSIQIGCSMRIVYAECMNNREFARRGTHLYAHDFVPLLGFLFVWRGIKEKQQKTLELLKGFWTTSASSPNFFFKKVRRFLHY